MDFVSQAGDGNSDAEPGNNRPIHPMFRFLIASALAWVINWSAGTLAFAIFGSHVLLADMVYRASTAAVLIAAYALLLDLLDHYEGDRLARQGLPLTKLARTQFFAGLLFGTVLIAFCVVVIMAYGTYSAQLSLTFRTLRFAVEIVILLLGGALLEEVMFRGYPFQRLVDAVGSVWAVIVLSGLFAVAHLGNPNAGGIWTWAFLNTIVIGVLLAVAYLRTRALWLSFGIHFGWNFALGFLFGLPVSGMTDFSVVVSGTAQGPQWLTGGAYGIENSPIVSVLLLVGIPILLRVTSGSGPWGARLRLDA